MKRPVSLMASSSEPPPLPRRSSTRPSIFLLHEAACSRLLHIDGGADGAVLHVGVEGGKIDPAELERLASSTGGVCDEFGIRQLLLQFDFAASDRDVLGRRKDHPPRRGAILRRTTVPALPRIISTILLQLHVLDVDPVAGAVAIALGHGHDAVVELEFALLVGRTADDDALDLGHVVLLAQERADAHERVLHLDVEVVHLLLAHVFRVRIVARGEAGEEVVHHVLVLVLAELLDQLLVALQNPGFGGSSELGVAAAVFAGVLPAAVSGFTDSGCLASGCGRRSAWAFFSFSSFFALLRAAASTLARSARRSSSRLPSMRSLQSLSEAASPWARATCRASPGGCAWSRR